MCYKDEGLFKNLLDITLSKWNRTGHGRISQVHVDSLLVPKCVALAVTIKKSGFHYSNAGLELFAAGRFETTEIIEQYYGTMV